MATAPRLRWQWRAAPRIPIGILSRSDLLSAHQKRLEETHVAEQSIDWRKATRNSID